MKYLLVMAIVMLVVWRWHSARRGPQRPLQTAKSPTLAPTDMLRCSHCGLHVPAQDAVRGARGAYCGAPHRDLAEH